MKHKNYKFLISILGILLSLILFCLWQNNSLVVTNSTYSNIAIPRDFNDFKIVHISDLHNKSFGVKQSRLLNTIKKQSPDLIIITGDLVDRRRFDLESAMHFISGAVNIAPVYYVPGNHEAWSGKYSEVAASLTQAGVTVMEDTALELSIADSSIRILGLSDPDFLTSNYLDGTNTSHLEAQLLEWSSYDGFKILLSHRPELFDLYYQYDMDLIFTGHAHGGQFRLPFVGGLFAPDQGLLPKYTSGSYTNNSTTMFVSRGLGNSVFPLRLFNRPEIISVTLKSLK